MFTWCRLARDRDHRDIAGGRSRGVRRASERSVGMGVVLRQVCTTSAVRLKPPGLTAHEEVPSVLIWAVNVMD